MRRMALRSVLRFIGALSIFVALHANNWAAESRPTWDLPGPDWPDGPARFLLGDDQAKAYHKLSTDEERASFVDNFWAHHNPTPNDSRNDFREILYREVEDANSRFSEGTTQGWESIRGKTLLMAGYPDDWRGSGEAEEIWTYKVKVRDPRIHDAGVNTQWLFSVGFRREGNGSYQVLKYEDHAGLKDLLQYLQGLQPAEYLNYLTARGVAPPTSKGRVNHMAAVLNTIDPGFDDYTRMEDSFKEGTPKQEFPLQTAAHFFEYSSDETLVMLVLALNTADAKKDAAGGVLFDPLLEIERLKAPKRYRLGSHGQDRFTVFADDQSGRVFYGWSHHVPPGEYEFRAAALDGPGGRIASHKEHITVPDFAKPGLSLSSITPVRLIQNASTDPKEWDQFRIGAKHLVPWLNPVRPTPDGLQLFFQTYGVKGSKKADSLPLDITIDVQRRSDTGESEALSAPISIADPKEGSIIATLGPDLISQWTAGNYRITVIVRDRSRNTSVSATQEFQFLP